MARQFKARPASPFLTAQAGLMEKTATPFLDSSKFHHTFEADVDKIFPDISQPRKVIDENELEQLSSSLERHGQLQPILVRPRPEKDGDWIIVAGERRWRAASQLGWSSLLAIEYTGDYASASLVENLLRVDLSAVDEARALKKLIDHNGWSQSEAARQIGLSQPRINRSLRILNLPEEFLNSASELRIPVNVLVPIVRERDDARRAELMGQALSGELTVSVANQSRSTQSLSETEKSAEPLPRQRKSKASLSLAAIKNFSKKCRELPHSALKLSVEDRNVLMDARSTIDLLLSKSDGK